jgi:hypothetical protein
LPFKIDMNLDSLKRDPVGQLKSFIVAVGAPTSFQHVPPYETLALARTWPMRLNPPMCEDICRTGEACVSQRKAIAVSGDEQAPEHFTISWQKSVDN